VFPGGEYLAGSAGNDLLRLRATGLRSPIARSVKPAIPAGLLNWAPSGDSGMAIVEPAMAESAEPDDGTSRPDANAGDEKRVGLENADMPSSHGRRIAAADHDRKGDPDSGAPRS